MSLLGRRLRRKRISKKKLRLRPYTTLRCPVNGHQVSWCRALCEPVDGVGICGRPAPHAMLGRTQQAIAAFKARRAEASA